MHVQVTALMFGCSGTQIHGPEVRDEGSAAQVSHETTIEPQELVYYLGLEP